ncbi:hypothetical protein ACFXK0_24015 [Nocardia sp. NPDC059177]|uniref:hypothetical protein n=1 Tax=Nocardia sp. NPDC059177 TaxID=3346759 RepID=UPI0036C21B38
MSESETGETDLTKQTEQAAPQPQKGTVALRVSSLIGGGVIAVLAIIAIVLGVLLGSARSDLSDRDAQAADDARAEQIALDYAVGSGTVNFQDYNAWLTNLKAGTSKPVADKFDAASPKLEQILSVLKWTSSATPIAAKVMSHEGEVYQVDAFVDVSTTNAQNPEPQRNTVLFTITVDAGQDWKITDVGGTDSMLPVK